mmetsp:Transcript_52016/g.145186  ORF Transcript_52016/g.145186 Transcript_52016/m.145186 type:complete len:85 (-) Transcript_52016:57-311(-)
MCTRASDAKPICSCLSPAGCLSPRIATREPAVDLKRLACAIQNERWNASNCCHLLEAQKTALEGRRLGFHHDATIPLVPIMYRI